MNDPAGVSRFGEFVSTVDWAAPKPKPYDLCCECGGVMQHVADVAPTKEALEPRKDRFGRPMPGPSIYRVSPIGEKARGSWSCPSCGTTRGWDMSRPCAVPYGDEYSVDVWC